MKRIKFGDTDVLGRRVYEPIAINEKDDLLAFFISDTKHNINETIKDLESVYKGDKSFEEIMEDYAGWAFGSGSGTFECDQKTAYFTSEVSNLSSMQMPLKELIDILYEWKAFLGK